MKEKVLRNLITVMADTRVPWLKSKTVDFESLQLRLTPSLACNHVTNGGPAVKSLEKTLRREMCINDDKALVLCSNATTGMHALVAAIDHDRVGNDVRYCSSAFTFPSNVQGPLNDTVIVDCDPDGQVRTRDIPEECDGLIVTNLFGVVKNMERWVAWERKRGVRGVLLFDNACTPFTNVALAEGEITNACNLGTASVVSMHHTKPIGFGEGGVIIVDRGYEPTLRRMLNFGLHPTSLMGWLPSATNAKMSDVAAVFIAEHLRDVVEMQMAHKELLQRVGSAVAPIWGVRTLYDFVHVDDMRMIPFCNCVPLVFERPTSIAAFVDSGIEAKKYYHPLRPLPGALYLFDRIVCVPCHEDIADGDAYAELVASICSTIIEGG